MQFYPQKYSYVHKINDESLRSLMLAAVAKFSYSIFAVGRDQVKKIISFCFSGQLGFICNIPLIS